MYLTALFQLSRTGLLSSISDVDAIRLPLGSQDSGLIHVTACAPGSVCFC